MAFEPRPGSGSLFKNDKQGNDRAPDYKGDLTLLDGSKVRLAGWIKQGQKGSFLSISIDKPREEAPRGDSFSGGDRSSDRGVSGGDRDDPFGSDVPF